MNWWDVSAQIVCHQDILEFLHIYNIVRKYQYTWSGTSMGAYNVIFDVLISNPLEQTPSWEANRSLSSQEIPHILFMEPEASLQHSLERYLPLSCARSIQFMPHPTSSRSFWYYPPMYTWIFQTVSFPQVSPLRGCRHFWSPPYWLIALPISLFLILSPE